MRINLIATKLQQVCHHFLQAKLEKQAAEYAPLPAPPQQPSQPQASKPPPMPQLTNAYMTTQRCNGLHDAAFSKTYRTRSSTYTSH